MAAAEKWDFADVFVSRAAGVIPPPGVKPAFEDVGARSLDFQPPRIDLVVQTQLGERLTNPANLSDWRLYTALLGLRIFVGLPVERRHSIFAGTMLSGFAVRRFSFEKSAREQLQAARQERDKEKAEKIAKAKAMEEIEL